MAIEPISSIMTMQAQGSVAQRPQTTVQTERPENGESSVPVAEQVDKTTTVVENAQNKGQGRNQSNSEQSREQQATNEQIKKAVEELNKKMSAKSEAVFGIHEETNRVTIKIVDRDTKETLKELPPEKTLDMIAKVWEMAGILVDERR